MDQNLVDDVFMEKIVPQRTVSRMVWKIPRH